MRYHSAKVDANQPQIVKELRVLGYSVEPVHRLKNFCDIAVGYKGFNFLFEIKADSKGKLTEGEQKFFDRWTGQVDKISSSEEIVEIIKNMLKNIDK